MALGVAALGAVGAAVYRNRVVDELPTGAPADVAHDSLAGAMQAIGGLPEQLRAGALVTAREAFVAGFTTIAVVSAVMMTGDAVLVVRALRHVPPTGGDTAPADAGFVAGGGTAKISSVRR